MSKINTDNINRSYMIGCNDELGWKVRHYFTFYGEFQRTNAILPYVEAVMLCAILLVAVTGNSLVLIIICTGRRRHLTINYFIANLALASVLTTGSVPLAAVTRITETWIFGSGLCSLTVFTEYCGAIITVWTMAVLSIDRHRRSDRKSPLSPRTVIIVLGSLWVLVVPCGVPLALYFVIREFPLGTGTVQICTLVWPNVDNFRVSVAFAVPSVLLMFVVPLLVISLNYIRVMATLKASVRKFKSARRSCDWSRPGQSARGAPLVCHRELRVVRFLILLVATFCVFWMPISISFLLILYDGLSDALIMTSQLFVASVGLAMTNACVSPVVYAFVNERYRHGLRRLFRRRPKSRNVVRPLPVFVVDPPRDDNVLDKDALPKE